MNILKQNAEILPLCLIIRNDSNSLLIAFPRFAWGVNQLRTSYFPLRKHFTACIMDMLTAFTILIKGNTSSASSLLQRYCDRRTFFIVQLFCNQHISVLLSDIPVNENVLHDKLLCTINCRSVLTQGRNKRTYAFLSGRPLPSHLSNRFIPLYSWYSNKYNL